MRSNVVSPRLIIVMGVSGCGKSSVGEKISADLSYRFIEADDFHSAQAKQQMASGVPLTDEQRQPWLKRLVEHLSQLPLQDSVMAYSGLRKAHRELFRHIGYDTLFIHLSGEAQLITERMQSRDGHFMPSSMLASQYAALQPTDAEADVVTVDINSDFSTIIQQVHAAALLV